MCNHFITSAPQTKANKAAGDLEFALLEIQNAVETTADELDKTDPAEAARIRTLFHLNQDPDPDDLK